MKTIATRNLSWGEEQSNISQSSEFNRNIAVVIGIDQYTNGIPPLTTAVNDAHRLAYILEQEHGYRVIPLTDAVTLASLESLFHEELPNQINIGEDDRLLVYFAGHGVAMDGDNGPAGYLIPEDARREDSSTFWPMTDLHEALNRLPCRHMLAILDCCFAGAFRWASTRDLQPLPPVIYQERYERFIRDPAWQVITSAAYDQKALDILSGNVVGKHGITHKNKQQHSPFALALFEALHGAADSTPKEGDGVITATELYLYLRDQVEVSAEQLAEHQQTPGLWPLNKHSHGEFIFLVPDYKLNLPPAPDLTKENNPYLGLSAYEEADKDLFFGRSTLIKQLRLVVAEQPLTIVLGASGTGKSSLVKAGLLPALKTTQNSAPIAMESEEAQSLSWFVLPTMRPGTAPLSTLYTLLINHLPGINALRKKDSTLTGLITQWSKKNPGQKLLLVIDQFEELVTLCREEQDREAFLLELVNALESQRRILHIVLTLRSDFEPQIAQTDLQTFWNDDSRFIVPPMSQDELREVIEQPASVKVLYFEPFELIDQLINEVLQTPGALPLLSFTLSELYLRYVERGDGNRALTEADYEAIGGVIGSLRRRINHEYEMLDTPHQATMRRILLRMVAFEGGELTRRRVPTSELDYPDPLENKRVNEILNILIKARLIVEGSSVNSSGELEPYVEPAHDALIVAWDKLLMWQAEEAETMLLQRQLTQAAVDWESNTSKKDRKGLLWDDNPRLIRTQEILELKNSRNTQITEGYEFFRGISGDLIQFCKVLSPSFNSLNQNIWLNRVETDFIRQSIERKRNRTRGVTAFISTVAVFLLGATLYAWQQRDTALDALAETEAKLRQVKTIQLSTESEAISNNTDKLFYSWRAGGGSRGDLKAPSFTEPLRLAREAVLETLNSDQYVTREAFDALRKAVETAPPWKKAIPIGMDYPSFPSSIAWSPTGELLAAISQFGEVVVWNTVTNGEIGVMKRSDDISDPSEQWYERWEEWLISWCGNSQFLISSADGLVQLFDLHSIKSPKMISEGTAGTVAVCNSSGTKKIFYDTHELYLSDIDDNVWADGFDIPDNSHAFSFSPDDNYVSFISNEGLHIWSFIKNKEVYILALGEGENILHTKWRFDKNILRLFAIRNNITIERDSLNWEGLPTEVQVESFTIEGRNSSESKQQISSDADFRLQETSRNTITMQPHDLFYSANKVVFSPDDRWIATAHGECSSSNQGSGCEDVAVRIWNVKTGTVVREMYGHASYVTALSWHPDSNALASGGNFNGAVGLIRDDNVLIWKPESFWDINGWGAEEGLSIPENIDYRWPTAAFWGQDNDTINIAGCVGCWGEKPLDLQLVSWNINTRAWDYNGYHLSERGLLDNNSTGQTINAKALLPDPKSPDGRKELFWLNRGMILPAYSEDSWEEYQEEYNFDTNKEKEEKSNVIRITNHKTGETVRLIGHESWVSTAEWSPGGRRVLTSSSDGTVRIWDSGSGRETARYELNVDTFARATWSPDGKWILVGYPEVIILPADVNELLNKADSLIKALDGDGQ